MPEMLYTGFLKDHPVAVRYPRGSGPGVAVETVMTALPWGRAEVRRRAERANGRIAILAFGSMVAPAQAVGEDLDATVVNMRFVKPIDEELVRDLAMSHDLLVTVEENVVAGGAGAACAEVLARAGIESPLMHLGLPDRFIDHGDPVKLLAAEGLDTIGIRAAIVARYQSLPVHQVKKIA